MKRLNLSTATSYKLHKGFKSRSAQQTVESPKIFDDVKSEKNSRRARFRIFNVIDEDTTGRINLIVKTVAS